MPKFKGRVSYVKYYDDKSSWGVIEMEITENIPYSKLRNVYNFETNQTEQVYVINVVGNMPKVEIGFVFEVVANHEYSQKYKQDQYKISSMSQQKPQTIDEQKAYLNSICTERQAKTLLDNYPNIVDLIISGNDNIDLGVLKGIGQQTYETIREKVIENFAIADILVLLVPLGVSFKKIQRLLNGEKSPQILKKKLIENPYVLTDINGITFKTIDKIAVQLNPEIRISEKRLVAYLKYFLEKAADDNGDVYFPLSAIRDAVIAEVGEIESFFDDLILRESENPSFLFINGERIGLKKFYDSEKFIFETIETMNSVFPLEVNEEAIQNGIEIAESQQGFSFTDEQKELIVKLTKNNFGIIRGSAGTGKSTVSRGLLNVYAAMGYDIAVASFSAKAAIRARETTGFPSQTIHRLLGIGMEKDVRTSINQEVILIDEASMLPLYLAKMIFKAIDPTKQKVIFCGDSRQLPPIGAGNVFSDLVEKENINIASLTKIQRQAQDSGIIVDANKIRNGESPFEQKEARIVHGINKDMFYIFRDDKNAIFNIAVSTYLKSVKEKGIDNVVLLCPRKKDVLNSTYNYNKTIQKELNSENEQIKFIHGKKEFWLRDKVIHLVNNKEKNIYNGETGIVKTIETKKMIVDFPNGEVEYTHEDVNELDLAYAITIHKSQGSEYLDVITVLDSSHFMLLSSQLLYVSITRAKERSLVISDTYSFDKCLEEDKTIRRTWLKDMKFSEVKEFIKYEDDKTLNKEESENQDTTWIPF